MDILSFAVCVGSLALCGFIYVLSYKERRELLARSMCRNVDEYIKVSSVDNKSADNAYVAKSRQLIKKFKQKGVNN